jgi:hypothetical protein
MPNWLGWLTTAFTGGSSQQVLSHNFASSALARAEYDTSLRTLDIYFTDGTSGTYYNVPPDVYAGLIRAGSAGQFFNYVIRNNYGYQRR